MKDLKIKTVHENKEKMTYIHEVWNILNEGYKKVVGGLHFKSKYDLIIKTHSWKVVCYKGEVIAVTVYKVKRGLKLVALSAGEHFRDIAVAALRRVLKRDLKHCWMELSEAAERFVMSLGGAKYILPVYIAEKVLEKEIHPAEDGAHYIRTIMGIKKEKVLLGTIKL